MAEDIDDMKFATVVSRVNDVTDYKLYPLLNKKWEGEITDYDECALMGTISCGNLGQDFDMFINNKVINQKLKTGEKVHFIIHVIENKLIATNIERYKGGLL